MKKLCKIKLNDAAIMTDSEMKYIFGGTGIDTGSASTGYVECKDNKGKDGCENDGAKCHPQDTSLEGKCEWRSYTGSEGSKSFCNCVNRPNG